MGILPREALAGAAVGVNGLRMTRGEEGVEVGGDGLALVKVEPGREAESGLQESLRRQLVEVLVWC